MKFWMQFTEEVGKEVPVWHIAFTPDFDAVTQGRTPAEARTMALDLLLCHLEDVPQNFTPARKPGDGEGWEQVEVPEASLLALSVRRARLGQGLTLQQAAERCGVKIGTYQRWENPYKFNPTFDTLGKLAKALGKRLEVSLV